MTEQKQDLISFLKGRDLSEVEEITIKGVPFPFKVRALTTSEHNEITRRSVSRSKKREVDINTLNLGFILDGCVEPDFRSSAFVKSLNLTTPEQAVQKLLLPGEMAQLVEAILKKSGFIVDEVVEEAKN